MAYDPRLGERFMFEEADLQANRRGVVSDAQAQGFDTTVRVMRRGAARSRVLLTIVFAVVIALVVVAISATPGGGLAAGLVAGGILAWILLIIAFFMRRGKRLTDAFEQRRVLTAEGPLRIGTSVTEAWWAHVGEARFAVELVQAQAMEEGAVYRVHYLEAPDGDIPISLERM